ncbi:MAG: CHAT domain-containing protein [Minicystis sp.]
MMSEIHLEHGGEGALWDRAQRREAQGDLGGALADYKALTKHLFAAERPIPALLVDRLGTLAAELGYFDAAAAVIFAARSRMRELGDAYGDFRMTLKLAQVCLGAMDRASAVRHLQDALGPRVDFSGSTGVNALLAAIRDMRFPGRGAGEAAMARVDACLTLARLWASTGRFAAAIAMTEEALALLPGAEAFYPRSSVGIFLVELHLDRGDVAGAIAAERAHRPAAIFGDDAARWTLVAARRQILTGQLSEARRVLTEITRRSTAPRRLDMIAAWLLATICARLNRVSEAREVLAAVRARLAAYEHPLYHRWALELDALAHLVDRKRASASREAALPFVPEQAWFGEVEAAPPASIARPSEPVPSDQERFADRWAAAANAVRLALDRDNVSDATAAMERLSALTAGTDAPRLLTRTRYLEAIFAYRAGAYERASELLFACADEARAQGLAVDELEYLEPLSWVAARLGHAEEYLSRAAAAKRRHDELIGALDQDDRRYQDINQVSRRDALLVARIAELAKIPPSRFPIAKVAAWLDTRRRRSALVERYRDVCRHVGWDLARRLSSSSNDPPPEPEPAATSDHVEAWIRSELRLARRRSGVDHSFLAARWPLARIPRSVGVLQFYAVARKLFVFLLQRGDIALWVLPTTRIELDEAVREAIESMSNEADGVARPGEVERALWRIAEDIGLPGVLAQLGHAVERLVVVPHDTLVHVPFAALPAGGGRLCERVVISVAPSPAWIDVAAAARSCALPLRHFLGVGVERYDDVELPPLPGAIAEVNDVTAILGERGISAQPLTRTDARPETIIAALASANAALFACHGIFDRDHPHRSHLRVSGSAEGTTEPLSIATLQGCDLHRLSFVALGACWMGSAVVLPGGELVCLPAALMRAGARAVIAPLWPVGDNSDRDFMRELHAELGRAPSAIALANVQRAWLRSSERRHSSLFRWAGYVHYGEG